MARNAVRPKGGEESVEVRAVADETYFKGLLDKVAKGDADATEELRVRVMMPTSQPFTAYDIDALQREKLETGRRSHRHIVGIAMTDVGKHLKEARRRARMKQAEAADELRKSKRTLQRIENGEKTPSLEFVLEASWLYGTHVERVLGLIDADAERLLDLYEISTPSNRGDMIKAAELVQAGRLAKFAGNIERDRAEREGHAERRVSERLGES